MTPRERQSVDDFARAMETTDQMLWRLFGSGQHTALCNIYWAVMAAKDDQQLAKKGSRT